MPALSVGRLLVKAVWVICRYPENVDEVIVHVFLYIKLNNMEYIVIVFITLIVMFVISEIQAKNQKEKDEMRGVLIKRKVNKAENFNASIKIVGIKNLYTIAIDEKNRKVAYFDEKQETIIPYDEIISVELIENNTTIASKSTMRTIGGALAGGALGGGAGAVVGGLSGNTSIKKKVSLVQVKLRIRNISMPTLSINCFDCKTMTGGEEVKPDGILGTKYKLGMEHANKIVDLISVIIDDVDKEEKKSQSLNTNNSSIADELAKLADLKAKGILTEDEFYAQKSKLLN